MFEYRVGSLGYDLGAQTKQQISNVKEIGLRIELKVDRGRNKQLQRFGDLIEQGNAQLYLLYKCG